MKKVAKVQTETLRVRKKASTDSKIVTLVSEDDKLKVKKQTNDWAKSQRLMARQDMCQKDLCKSNITLFGKAKIQLKQIQAEQEAKRGERKEQKKQPEVKSEK